MPSLIVYFLFARPEELRQYRVLTPRKNNSLMGQTSQALIISARRAQQNHFGFRPAG
jgi:hypothetical protein